MSDRRYRTCVLAYHLCFFIWLSSGRLGSADAGAQLQTSMLLATSGRLGSAVPPATGAAGWPVNSRGMHYEPHDLGNALLLLPAAAVGHALSGRPARADFDAPPVTSRVLSSLTYATVSALGCFFMFRLLALGHPRRVAYLLSLALPVTTMYGAYAKTAWDVMGAGCALCAVLYYATLTLRETATRRDVIGLGLACVVACTFRYSLAPFLIGGVALTAVGSWRRHGALLALVVVVGLLPSLAYNAVRTGSALRPATATTAYLASNNAVTLDVAGGLAGLLASPNRSFFLFCPACVLLGALPWTWRTFHRDERRILAAIGGPALLYVVFIASLQNWGGTFGWGPRFLVPIVPVAFYGAALVLISRWGQWRGPLVGALTVSVLLSAAPLLVNWSAAIVTLPEALDQHARRPYQHIAVWRQLGRGLRGEPPQLPAALARDPERSAGGQFPDLWTVRLMERPGATRIAGGAIFIALLSGAIWTVTVLLRDQRVYRNGRSVIVTS